MHVLHAGGLPARLVPAADDLLIEGESADVLARLPPGTFDMAYVDSPFNTGRPRRHERLRAVRDERGDRAGFGGRRYRTESLGGLEFDDAFADYLGFLMPRLAAVRRVLADHGTLYVHLDPRESHYVKVALDGLFGRDCFLNEIVWAYDYGGRPRRRWPPKHDTILVYVRDPERYHFDDAEVDREPYMAPGLVTPEKRARGKRPSDTWWHTIVPTNGAERTGYPTQKPLGIVRRMVAASSRPGGWCLDCFAGSGTLGVAARALGRRFVLVDRSPDAIAVAAERLSAPGRATAGSRGTGPRT
jgi:site-specific DNA-methyltransferase (adenine-specific)